MSDHRRRVSTGLIERAVSIESDELTVNNARRAASLFIRRAFARFLRWLARKIEPRNRGIDPPQSITTTEILDGVKKIISDV